MYLNGKGVAKDPAEAVKWYRKLADQPGHSSVQLTLGQLYAAGSGVAQGVAQDFAEAARWYRKAADQEDVVAATSLGDLYAEGRGVKQDDAEAARWYRRAAERGHPAGQYRLARAYLNGRGVAGDPVQGYAWLELAASGDAAKYGAERDSVRSLLNPKQLAEAEKQVREFKPKRGQ